MLRTTVHLPFGGWQLRLLECVIVVGENGPFFLGFLDMIHL
jgi:hypothetical protein